MRFLSAQYTERDGVRHRLIAAHLGHLRPRQRRRASARRCWSARARTPCRYHQGRNEQAMVHAAVGYARQLDRLSAQAVTTSIGPGATNLVTGAALATVNRLPVLLLPGDIFATRARRPGAPAAGVPVRGRRVRQRRAAPGLALLRPGHPPRGADPLRAPGDAGARRPRRDRRRHPRPAAGRAGRGVRLAGGVLRRARLARTASARPTPAELAEAVAADPGRARGR